jgi:predicted KAP-like P-loop ATPase/uncharacterized protein YuzE
MAIGDIQEYLSLLPAVERLPRRHLGLSYDREADVLYVNFKKPSIATDSELTDDDVIVRYEGNEVIGLTILHASQRRLTNTHQFSADRPIQFRRQDLLGRAGFAESLASAIKGWKGHDSLVVALYGPWGSGKSSIKNMMLESLRQSEHDCPHIVEFNPWEWSGQDRLAAAFFHEVGIALGKADASESGKKRAAKWLAYGSYLTLGASLVKSVASVLPSLGVPPTVGVEPFATGLEAAAKAAREGAEGLEAQAQADTRPLSELKRDLAEALTALEKPIFVIMDDVDRLSTNEITLLFQLVKGNADFPNMVYLLLFQRDIVEKSLIDVAPLSGREFLEKIVQVGFDIPGIERSRLEKVLSAGLDELLIDNKIGQRFDQQRWGNIFIPGLRPYFETLRDVYRFLSTLAFHVTLFRTNGGFEVNPIDLIALEVLRVFEPEVYQQLPEAKTSLTELHDSRVRTQDVENERRRLVESIVHAARESKRPQIREILTQLFPPIAWVFGGSHYSLEFEERWYRELRVCHPHVFDRYFQLATPTGDISQADLDRLLSLLGNRQAVVAEFRALNRRALLGVTLNRLESYKETIGLEHAVPFVTALFDIGDELPEEPPGFFSISAEDHASRIIHWNLKQEKDPRRRGQILKEAMRATSGLYLPVRKTSIEASREKRESPPDAFLVDEADVRELQSICVAKIRESAASGVLKTCPHLIFILYRWGEWTSPEEPQQWVAGLIESPEGLFALLTASLEPHTAQGLKDYVSRISWRVRLKYLEDFVSLDVLTGHIEQLRQEDLTEEQRRAIDAFQKALKRRQAGQPDDDWLGDDGE